MKRAERLMQLLQILRRHRRPVTAEVIAAELEVSLRTIYRDIASLIADRVRSVARQALAMCWVTASTCRR